MYSSFIILASVCVCVCVCLCLCLCVSVSVCVNVETGPQLLTWIARSGFYRDVTRIAKIKVRIRISAISVLQVAT